MGLVQLIQRASLKVHFFAGLPCVLPCRSISIMKQARAKLRLIGPEDMDMDKYRVRLHLFCLEICLLGEVVL